MPSRLGTLSLLSACLLLGACRGAQDGAGGPTAGACSFWAALDGALADWMVEWRTFHPGLNCQRLVASDGTRLAPTGETTLAIPVEPERLEEMTAWPSARARQGGLAVMTPPGSEPDSAVFLVDEPAGTARRLLFCGTPCGFDRVAWLPDGRLVVAGWAERGSGAVDAQAACTVEPLLRLIDLERESVQTFRGPGVDCAAFRSARAR